MAIVTIFFWAANYPATRYVLPYYSAVSISVFRILTAAAVLIVVGVVKKIRLPYKRDLPKIVFGGFLGIFLFNIFFSIGAENVVSGVGSFIINSAPIFALIMSRLFLKEIVKPACWIGVILSFCGLVTVMLSQTAGFSFSRGVIILLLAANATSAYNVILRSLLKTYTYFETAAYCVTTAAVFFLTLIPFIIRDLPASPPLSASLVVVLSGVFATGLAYLTWGYAMSKAEKTAHITVFMYLTPFIASLIGYLWLGDTMTTWALLGGFVIIAGMLLTNTLGKSQ